MKLEIINWEKHNPRKDLKATAWFRLQNTFWQDHKLFGLGCEGKMVWIALLSMASQEQSGLIEVEPKLVAAILEVKVKVVIDAVSFLEKIQCVKVHVTSTLRQSNGRVPLQTNKQTNRQTNNNAQTEVRASDLEALYKNYPRKAGKSQGLKKAKSQIRTKESLLELKQAIANFIAYHQMQKTEPQFIPYFSTFMNSWRDWLDPEVGSSENFNESAVDRELRLLRSQNGRI